MLKDVGHSRAVSRHGFKCHTVALMLNIHLSQKSNLKCFLAGDVPKDIVGVAGLDMEMLCAGGLMAKMICHQISIWNWCGLHAKLRLSYL